MKKTLFTLAIVLMSIMAAQAQFKMHDDGHISIGSLARDFGIQVQPNRYTYFRAQHNTPYGWVTNSYSNKTTMQNWMVKDLDSVSKTFNEMVFAVYGSGIVWAKNHYTYGANHTVVRAELEPIDKERALSAILQLQGYYYDEYPIASPEEIMESEYVKEEAKESMVNDLEKREIGLDVLLLGEAFPDAVRTDPEARLCIDNNAVITLLVEAIKQQQEEIILLQRTLEENGLTRKQP